MNPLFFGDPNHDEVKHITEFVQRLPGLKLAGYKTLFLEFLLEQPPLEHDALKEQFIFCSAGKYGIAAAYVEMVEKARALEFEVWGLEQPDYYAKSRAMPPAPYFAFRWLGSFDAVAAEVIRQRAVGRDNYVVRLGKAHWPLLSPRLPGLECAANKDESLESSSKFSAPDHQKALLWQEQYLYALVDRVLKVLLTGGLSMPNLGGRIAIGVPYSASVETIAILWKVADDGFPPDMDRMTAIRAVYAKREMPVLVLKLKS